MSQGIRYRVHRKIARGGMAEIFLASQIGLEGFEKPVVLKRILPALASDPGFLRMLLDEAHIVSGLNHTNLVQVLDLWRADGQFFLVLEFVDGWSLEQVRMRAAKAKLKLPLHLSLSITASLCRALNYVHRHTRNGEALGIVHRDVTPQNVLLSREGDVKLADFGIAKAVGRREKSAIGIIKGKFAYMSPEQSIGADLDARSDLFSVGSLLYVLTTGHKPFGGKTDLDTLMQVRRARHAKPSAHVRDFNPDVERFIERALRADRSRRWQSAEQMADRLDNILVKLGQPSGPAALKRWLATLGARDGVLSPGDLRDQPLEPATQLLELSSTLQDSEPATANRQARDDEEELATRAGPQGEATHALSELDLEVVAVAPPPLPAFESTPTGTGTMALQLSELEEHTPSVAAPPATAAPVESAAPALTPVTPAAEPSASEAPLELAAPALTPVTPPAEPSAAEAPIELAARALTPALTPTEEPVAPAPATSAPTAVPTPPATRRTPAPAAFAVGDMHPDIAPAARAALVARRPNTLRRAAILTFLLSLLLGSGMYVARPFLPDWLPSSAITKWFDRMVEQLPHLLDPRSDHSSSTTPDSLPASQPPDQASTTRNARRMRS